jgi:hypothetical protein
VPFILALKSAGKPAFDDPEFIEATVNVYNNVANNTTVSVKKIADDQNSGNTSGNIIKISSGSGTASPGRGGFYKDVISRAGGIFVHLFRAKIPIGYYVKLAMNSIGSGSHTYFITDTQGTGKWEWYAAVIMCGTSGTFSSFGFIYLDKNTEKISDEVTWYLAYNNIIDLTNSKYDGLRTKYSDYADQWSGNLLNNLTINNDSPTLLFRRGTLSDGKTDWRFIGDSGKFKLQAEVSGNAWTNVLEFSDIDDNTNKLSSYYSIDMPYDSRGFYLYGGCGIEKWSGYDPSLVAESGNDFWISNRSDRSARSKILHSSNYINYAAHTSAYCSTAAATAAKTAVCTNYTLTANTYTHLLITTSNTSKSALTLNINGKGAKRIWINGEISNENNYTLPAGTYLVFYDGFAYHINTEGHIPMYYKTSSRLYFTKKSVTMTTTLVPWYIKIELTGYAKPNQIIIKGEYNNIIDNAIIETSGFSKGYIYRNVDQNGGNIRGLWYKTVYDADEKRWIFWIKLDPI